MTTPEFLRREADRLETEGKARKWGLLDPGHQITDDGNVGRFVALEPDQLRFAAALAEQAAEPAAATDVADVLGRPDLATLLARIAALEEQLADVRDELAFVAARAVEH